MASEKPGENDAPGAFPDELPTPNTALASRFHQMFPVLSLAEIDRIRRFGEIRRFPDGELLCERAVERCPIRCTSIRPCWVQDEASYERNLGPIVRDPSVLVGNYCSYVDVHDLCDAVVLAVETDLPGHEVFYIASPDTIGGHPLVETVTTHYGAEGIEFRPVERADASAISTAKAERRLGWKPTRSWRDYLDDDGRART